MLTTDLAKEIENGSVEVKLEPRIGG